MPRTLTAYQSYRSMKWTTDHDACEHCGAATLSEGAYSEGRYGHYCSDACRDDAEGDGGISDSDERASERRQLGILD